MTDKEKILAKIELLLNETNYEPFTDEIFGRIKTLNELKSYIDSMQEEPVSKELEEACDSYYDETWDEHGGRAMVVDGCHDIWFPSLATDDFFKAGANWQKTKDQSVIELAEDHAMLAGMVKGKEDVVGKVRSILNKVAYKNNGLDVNGDYCEQPYVELDNKFRKLLKEG